MTIVTVVTIRVAVSKIPSQSSQPSQHSKGGLRALRCLFTIREYKGNIPEISRRKRNIIEKIPGRAQRRALRFERAGKSVRVTIVTVVTIILGAGTGVKNTVTIVTAVTVFKRRSPYIASIGCSRRSESKILPRGQNPPTRWFLLPWNLVGECLPQTLHINKNVGLPKKGSASK